MTRHTCGPVRAGALLGAVVLALVFGGACSKASKKDKQRPGHASAGKTVPTPMKRAAARAKPGSMVPVARPAVKAGDVPPATGAMAPRPTVARLGPAQKALIKTMKGGILGPGPATPHRWSAPISKPGFHLVVGLDVARLRKTAVWKAVQSNPTFKRYLNKDVFRAIAKAIRLKPTQVTDRLMVGFVSQSWRFGSPRDVVVRFEGRFDTARIMAVLRKLPAKLLGNTRILRIGDKDALLVAAPHLQPFVLIALKKNVLAFCSVGLASNVARELPGFGDPALVARLKRVDRKAMFWGTFGRIDGLLGGVMPAAGAGAVRRVRGGTFAAWNKGGTWRGEARIETASALVSEDLVTLLSMAKAALAAGGSSLVPAVLLRILKKMKIARQKQNVVVSAVLSRADAQAIPKVMLSLM